MGSMRHSSPQTNPFLSHPAGTGRGSATEAVASTDIKRDDNVLLPPRAVTGWPEEPHVARDKFFRGTTFAHKVLTGELLERGEVELLARDRQARVDFFSTLESSQDKKSACAGLHTIIASDGPPSHWFLRKGSFEHLRRWSAAPLSASLCVLSSTKDDALKAMALKVIMNDLSFPLSDHARQEILTIGSLGGRVCTTLLTLAPSLGERPTWVATFPQFVRAWILACSAVGVDHGVDGTALSRFSRDAGGPLNDWHIRRALEPLDPLSWGGFQAMMRRITKH